MLRTETVKKDDEVVLIGSQNELSVSVASFSDFSNQLNYELLTRYPKQFLIKSLD
jgi:alanine racemase